MFVQSQCLTIDFGLVDSPKGYHDLGNADRFRREIQNWTTLIDDLELSFEKDPRQDHIFLQRNPSLT